MSIVGDDAGSSSFSPIGPFHESLAHVKISAFRATHREGDPFWDDLWGTAGFRLDTPFQLRYSPPIPLSYIPATGLS